MDIFDEELILFWTTLNRCGVKYIMVGGVAVNLHGFNRTTDDIDLWLEDSLENRNRLRIAFKEYGIGDIEPLIRIVFIPGWTYFHLNNGVIIDIMTRIKGLEDIKFEEAQSLASMADIYDIKVPFLHLNHLIEAKKGSNCPKDQIDIIELEKNQKIPAILKCRFPIPHSQLQFSIPFHSIPRFSPPPLIFAAKLKKRYGSKISQIITGSGFQRFYGHVASRFVCQ